MRTWMIAAVAKDGAIGAAGHRPWVKPEDIAEGDWLLGDWLQIGWLEAIINARLPLQRAGIFLDHGWYLGAKTLPMNTVISGRRTWEELRRPLPSCHHVVLSRDGNVHDLPGARVASSLRQALILAKEQRSPNVFLIGGTEVFRRGLSVPSMHTMFLTEIDAVFPSADTWFPGFGEHVPWDEYPRADLGAYGHVDIWERVMAGPWELDHDTRYRFAVWQRA